nr:IS4 family transposase [Roseomonas acroporae]
MSRTQGKAADRRSRLVAEKKSQRWLDGACHAAAVCQSAARLTVVGDQENDIYQAFAACPPGADLLVRAAHDRALGDGGRLFAHLDALPIAGWTGFELPAAPGRKARPVQLAIRFTATRIAHPRKGRREGPESLAVTLIDVREPAPPPGAAAIHWRLMTTQRVASVEDALDVVGLYRQRWTIEHLFRTLKTQGFDIENLRIEDEVPLRGLVMATLLAAVTIQQLVHAREGNAMPGPLRPVTDAFEPEDQPLLEAFCTRLEGRTQRQKNPHPRGSLAYAAWVCARLGGWTGYYGKPGPIFMLNGWRYFQAAKAGARLHATAKNV